MAQPTVEQCLVTLTEILSRQSGTQNIRTLIEKRVKHLKSFSGEQGTLPSFIATVEQIFDEYGILNQEAVFSVIYNEKIEGAAKNYLAVEAPASWEQCKQKLKLHFRPTKDIGSILRTINNIKVNSINQLLDKIQITINYITECATYSDNGLEIANCLNSALILKIKELTAGALGAEIYNMYSISNIRTTLFKYLGQDEFNLKSERSFTHQQKSQNNRANIYSHNQLNRHNPSNQKQFDQVQPYQFNRNNYSNQNQPNRNNYSGQVRNNNLSGQARYSWNNRQFQNRPQNNENSGQFRSRQYRLEPMEVDVISNGDETNEIENHEFFIN